MKIRCFNKSFSELGFEYDKNGTVLTPWSNQFPDPIKYSSKKDIWLRGHQYEFKLFDGKVMFQTVQLEVLGKSIMHITI